MKIKSGLIALLTTGSVALGLPSELQIPKNLAVDLRDAQYSNLAGQSPFHTVMDGMTIWFTIRRPTRRSRSSSRWYVPDQPVLGPEIFPIAGPNELSIDIAG
jgi:hypothetical protein